MSTGIKRVRGREEVPSDSDASDFEDAFDDVYEDDEREYNSGSPTSAHSGSGSPTQVADGPAAAGAGMSSGMDEEADGGAEAAVATPWRPGLDAMGEGEVLEYDPSAYVMYHAMNVDWPCLSFDTVPDKLGASRSRFPMSCTVVAGTQADKASSNKVLVMRFGHLQRTQRDGREDDSDEGEDESDSDEDDDDPTVDVQRINHHGSVNRIRVCRVPGRACTRSPSYMHSTRLHAVAAGERNNMRGCSGVCFVRAHTLQSPPKAKTHAHFT